MLRAIDLSYDTGTTRLLDHINLTVGGTDRVGIVGRNGGGKTTLLRLLAGDLAATGGQVVASPGTIIGWQRQEARSGTVGEALDTACTGLLSAESALDLAYAHLAAVDVQAHDELDEAMCELDAATTTFQAAGGWERLSRQEAICDHLGVGTRRGISRDRELASLSGGEQSRVQLACLLLAEPTVLLLDEPTNHLDQDGRRWLTTHLADFEGAVLLVSHDRDFLDAATTRIVELDNGSLEDYPGGGWTAYRDERQRRRQRQQEEFEAQEKKRRALEASIAATKERSRDAEADNARNPHARRIARMVVRKAITHESRLRREIESHDWVQAPADDPIVRLSRPGMPRGGGLSPQTWRLRDLTVRAGDRVLASGLDLDLSSTDRIHLVGPNGVGKTSLLHTLTAQLDGAVTLPQGATHLDPEHTAIQVVRNALPLTMDDAEDLLTAYLFAHEDWARPLRALSAGQVQRLLIAIALHQPSRMLVLDEPTNHLDADTAMLLERGVAGYPGGLLVVSHDEAFARGVHLDLRWTLSRPSDAAGTEAGWQISTEPLPPGEGHPTQPVPRR